MLEGIGIGDNTNRKECNEYVEAFVESQAERRGLGGNQFLQKKYWLVFRHPRSSRPELRRLTCSVIIMLLLVSSFFDHQLCGGHGAVAGGRVSIPSPETTRVRRHDAVDQQREKRVEGWGPELAGGGHLCCATPSR